MEFINRVCIVRIFLDRIKRKRMNGLHIRIVFHTIQRRNRNHLLVIKGARHEFTTNLL